MTTRVIGDNGTLAVDVLIRDIVFRGVGGWDRFIEFSNTGSRGEIRGITVTTTATDVGLAVDGVGWLIHNCNIQCNVSVLILDADRSTVRNVNASPPKAFSDYAMIINGDDNIIEGCLLSRGIKVVGDRNHIVGNTFRMFDLSTNPTGGPHAIRVEGNDNYVHGNKVIEAASGGGDDTIPVGLEIVSGATDTVVGINDLAAATLPITDAGTGTIFKATRELTWFVGGTLTTGTGVERRRLPEDVFIIDAAAMCDTQPTGAAVIVDFHLNGTTIFTTQGNRPTIAISTNDSGLAIPDVTAGAAAQYLTMDVDQIGSTIAGTDLTGIVRYVNTGVTG